MRLYLLLIILISSFAENTIAQKFEWAKQQGGQRYDRGHSVAIDNYGNVYTTGVFSFYADFNPGKDTNYLFSNGEADIFISKLDAMGNFVWVKQIGGTGWEEGNSIVVDILGSVYITGSFSGTVDFDPSEDTTFLTSHGMTDIFVLKLDASGNYLWAKRFGGLENDIGTSITLDATGNIYTTGIFRGSVDFDPGLSVVEYNSIGDYDIFISKLDSKGNFIWAKQLGGLNGDASYSIAIDAQGYVYTTGSFKGTVDFDLGIDSSYLSSTGHRGDMYISKLDSNGNFVWAKQIMGTDLVIGRSITTDDSGNVYTTGYFESRIDFDLANGNINFTSDGYSDIFISKLDSNGIFVWAKQIGGSGVDECHSIAINKSGDIYTTGSFSESVDFDPGSDSFNLKAKYEDVFISKLDNAGNFIWAKQLLGTNFGNGTSLVLDVSNNIYTTGYFFGTVDFDPGKGTTNFIQAVPNSFSDIFVLKLSSCTTAVVTDTRTACNSYTWIDGKIYTSSNNNAQFIISEGAANGCDSIVTLNLTINNISDITTSTSGSNITANNNIATYQWLDCNNNFAKISGASNQIFSPTLNGSYAVELTENSCVDTSSCVVFSNLNIVENDLGFELVFYPNPTNGKLIIELGKELNNVQLTVRNLLGQEIYYKNYASANQIELNLESPSGIYLIEILSNGKKAVLKILKE
ncbi:MAG: SBBP repeat-containing protein [Bacteroidota bacterium]|nr:SBBP repeat-containing protein [Bacteroidota bacterium]